METKQGHVMNQSRQCLYQLLRTIAGYSRYGLGQIQDLVKEGLENSSLKGHPSRSSET